MPPVHPSNGGLSLSPLPGDVRAQSGRRRLRPKLFAKICRILAFQADSCLYVTAADFGRAYVAVAAQVCLESRLIGVCRELRRTHSMYMFNEACLGSSMRFGFIGFCPLHLVPFSSFSPSHTSVLLFSFMSSCLHVFHLILLRATTFTFNSGFRWPRSI